MITKSSSLNQNSLIQLLKIIIQLLITNQKSSQKSIKKKYLKIIMNKKEKQLKGGSKGKYLNPGNTELKNEHDHFK
jgi:hypothetical protein